MSSAKLRIVSENGIFAQTKVYDVATGALRKDIMDIKLYEEGGIWVADLKVFAIEVDITTGKVNTFVKCRHCQEEEKLYDK